MIQHYFKIALRNLLKYKTHSFISALCLSVGMVCFSTVGHLIDRLDGTVRNLSNYEQRIDFKLQGENADGFTTSVLRSEEVKILEERLGMEVEVFNYHARDYNDVEMIFIDPKQQERPFQVTYQATNKNFFAFYDTQLLYGNQLPQTPDEVIISESCARKVYGEQNPVGCLIMPVTKNKEQEKKILKIVNVATDIPTELNSYADIFIPCEGQSSLYNLYVRAMLASGTDLEQLNNVLANIKVNRDGNTLHFAAVRLADQYDDPGRLTIIAFITFLSSLILLSGIINFLKFIIQMFYNRHRELALRKCMGSNSKGLFMLLFAEVVWMLSISFLFALALTEIVVPWIYSYVPKEDMIVMNLPALFGKQAEVFLELLLVCVVVILIPIRRLQKISITRHINYRNTRHHFRNVMMGIQLCVCIFFLGTASGLIIFIQESIGYIYNPLSEHETEQIIHLNINSITMDKQKEAIMADIRKMPEVEHVIYTHRSNNVYSNSRTITTYQQENTNNTVDLLVEGGSVDYFEMFHIPLQGKVADTGSEDVVYVSKAFAQLLEQNSVKGMVKLDEHTYRIGGVFEGLYKEDFASKYTQGSVFFAGKNAYSYYLRVAEGKDVAEVLNKITQICRRYVPESIPLSVYRLDKEKRISASGIEMGRDIALVLACVSLLLVALSIYSSISMDTMSRQKEVAIRKINGATPRIIAALFGKAYCIIFVLAFTITFPLTFLVISQLLKDNSMLIEFNYWSWGVGLFIGIAALVILTTGYKIYRIMHSNPSEIIKTE